MNSKRYTKESIVLMSGDGSQAQGSVEIAGPTIYVEFVGWNGAHVTKTVLTGNSKYKFSKGGTYPVQSGRYIHSVEGSLVSGGHGPGLPPGPTPIIKSILHYD